MYTKPTSWNREWELLSENEVEKVELIWSAFRVFFVLAWVPDCSTLCTRFDRRHFHSLLLSFPSLSRLLPFFLVRRVRVCFARSLPPFCFAFTSPSLSLLSLSLSHFTPYSLYFFFLPLFGLTPSRHAFSFFTTHLSSFPSFAFTLSVLYIDLSSR